MDNLSIRTTLIIFLFLGFGVFLFMGPGGSKSPKKVCYKQHCFEAKIAKTKEEKRTGLMGTNSLPKDKGMLFLYSQPGIHSFWMKNTLIPLDIIWLNKNKHIVHIKHSANPCENKECPSFGPDKPAQYVLEIKGGRAKEIGLKKGEKMKFKN